MGELPDITLAPGVIEAVRSAVREDVGTGDATTLALVPAAATVRAAILTRQPCVVAGADVARAVFREVDASIRAEVRAPDGTRAAAGATILALSGPARGILTAERTALNFMQRLCGIATLTARFVERVAGSGVVILDTRKTTPGLRTLEKYAVRCGGGANHRTGLYDRILVKDNHRRLWAGGRAASLGEAVVEARRRYPDLAVEIEVESEEELAAVLPARPDWVLLDNMSPERLRRCVSLCAGRAKLEASGGITLGNVGPVAAAGVDAISLGCLTHSAPAVDLSLEIEEVVTA